MNNEFYSSSLFNHERYEELRKNYRLWWDGNLGRPLVPIITGDQTSYRKPSENPMICFPNAWDFSISPEQFVDAHDWWLSTHRWHGDAFPFFATTAFGPGTGAAFMGCTPVGTNHTVWFQPPRPDIPIEELHFEYDPNNKYLRRVINLYEAAMEKWHGSVVVGMVDMGGVLDILSSFRGVENLLMDMYDSPDEVTRCVREIQELWFKYYDLFNSMMESEAEGYSQWFNMYDEKPGYILQSDFSYMIGPDMFREFVAPELASSASRLHNAVYHMDGIGQIPHLDMILAIDGIKGIQWVPGDGEPITRNWDDLVSRILDSGKKLISWSQNPDGTPISVAKDPGQLYFCDRHYSARDIESAKRYGAMYGIDVTEK